MEILSYFVIIMLFIITLLILYFYASDKKDWVEERSQLLNRIQAKNLHEYVQVEKITKQKPKEEEKKEVHQFV